MALKKQESKISIPDEGTIPARVARIVEIGTHDTPYGVKDQCYIWYSLPTRLIDSPESDYHGKQSHIRTKPLTMSMNEKASLVVDHLTSLKPGLDLSAPSIDLATFLNLPLYVTVQHNPSKDGTKTYANIIRTMPLPEGMEAGELDTTPFYFDYENPDLDVWTKFMPEWLQTVIKESLNYRGSAVEDMVMRLEAMSTSTDS